MPDAKTDEAGGPSGKEGVQELLDEHVSDSSKCAECGDPVDNLRKTCPNCGHEYSDEELDDDQAGNEFKAGAALDDQGEEITDPDVFEE